MICVGWGSILCMKSVFDVSNEKHSKDDIYMIHRVQKEEKFYPKVVPSVSRNVSDFYFIFFNTN